MASILAVLRVINWINDHAGKELRVFQINNNDGTVCLYVPTLAVRYLPELTALLAKYQMNAEILCHPHVDFTIVIDLY
jgi:hypothetical protein